MDLNAKYAKLYYNVLLQYRKGHAMINHRDSGHV